MVLQLEKKLQLVAVVKHFILALKIGYTEHREAEKLLKTGFIRTKLQRRKLTVCTSVTKNNRAAAFSSFYSLS